MTASSAPDGAPRLAPEAFAERAQAIEREVGRVIVGQAALVRQTLTGLLANSHVLLEGVHGLGKTMLVRTIADVIDCTFNRIQFTPDLMPATSPHEHPHRGGGSGSSASSRDRFRQPRARRRSTGRRRRRSPRCSRRCRNTRSRSLASACSMRRSSCWRPRTRSRWRDHSSAKPGSTVSSSRSWSRSRPRRTRSRSWNGRPAPRR